MAVESEASKRWWLATVRWGSVLLIALGVAWHFWRYYEVIRVLEIYREMVLQCTPY